MNLEMIRRRHKWLTLAILIIISVAFIFGIGSFVSGDFGAITGGPTGSAAEVNGEEISIREYMLERENMRRQFSQGQELPQAAIDIINQRALDQLVDYKLLAQKARELGFAITNEEFNNAIHSDPSFQVDGQFVGVERYKNFIEQGLNQNLTDFENYYKERLLAQKLARFIGETVVVTDEKLINIYNLQNETINLNYIEFSSDDFISSEAPSEEEIAKYYEQNKSNFKADELRKIRYLILEPETFENKVKVTEEEINAYYNAYPEEFQTEEGTLIPFEEAKDSVESNLKGQRAEVVREEFLQTAQDPQANLEQIAKDNSIESINESKSFGRSEKMDDIPPQIVMSAFSQEKENLAVVPVGTSIWVLELSEISEPKEKALEEVKPEIIAAINNLKAKSKARTKANQALAKLKTAKKDEIAGKTEELGLSLSETGPFNRMESVPKINIEQIKSEAFETLGENVTLGKVYENNSSFYVVMIKDRASAKPEDFELEKETLREQELQTERNDLLLKWIQTLRREAKITRNEELFPAQG